MAAHAAEQLGPENVRRTRIRWSEQVWPGDVLTIAGEVTAVKDGHAEVELTCTRQTGAVAVRVWMTFALPSETS
jgi:hypothetical protein